mmetsp:Transcript_10865/g.19073  ORF Transcript_10865/g.19073 Transcript_10865/m.19073 type:complete len:253 (+) Transcript_10865:356-1114(+)
MAPPSSDSSVVVAVMVVEVIVLAVSTLHAALPAAQGRMRSASVGRRVAGMLGSTTTTTTCGESDREGFVSKSVECAILLTSPHCAISSFTKPSVVALALKPMEDSPLDPLGTALIAESSIFGSIRGVVVLEVPLTLFRNCRKRSPAAVSSPASFSKSTSAIAECDRFIRGLGLPPIAGAPACLRVCVSSIARPSPREKCCGGLCCCSCRWRCKASMVAFARAAITAAALPLLLPPPTLAFAALLLPLPLLFA